MVATADSIVKTKTVTGNKVSKPLMEKKRRARINTCLDQLKSLLENYYSKNIRKRKLEKADILELTVKHLRNLQKIKSCNATTTASELSEYQAGFSSCLTSVNQYLLMADNHNGNDRWMLSHLANNLQRCSSAQRPGDSSSSTMDSAGAHNKRVAPEEPAVMQRLLPSPAEPTANNKAPTNTTPLTRCCRAPAPHFSAPAAGKEVSSPRPESSVLLAPTAAPHATRLNNNTAQEKICSNVSYNNIKSHAVKQLRKDHVIITHHQQNVWRPW